jgi:UDP-glucose-4-epimerase GalE
MRVLVTGGAGYIGSQTVRALQARGDEVAVLDDLSTGHRAAVDGAGLEVASVTDPEAVDAIVGRLRPDAVIHFAALKAADESLGAPDRYMAVNVAGAITVLNALARHTVGRFVFSSSCAVYGTPASLPVRESAPMLPENPYGESKALVERMLPWYARAFGLRYASLRYFNAAGADPSGDHGEPWTSARNLVPRVLRAARDGGQLEVFGTDYPTPDGSAVRDYIHVVDLAEAHLAALDRLADDVEPLVLNLGTGAGSSVLEVVAAAREVTGRAIDVVLRPRRAGDPAAVWADASEARRRLGWDARLDLQAVLEDAWRWHERHPDGYGPAAGAAGR